MKHLRNEYRADIEKLLSNVKDFFNLLAKGHHAECFENKENTAKIKLLKNIMPDSLLAGQAKKYEGKSEEEEVAGRFEDIRHHSVACLLNIFDKRFQNYNKSLFTKGKNEGEINEVLADLLLSLQPDPLDEKALFKELVIKSSFLSTLPTEAMTIFLQDEIAETSRRVASKVGKEHGDQVATIIKQEILPTVFRHIFEPIATLIAKENWQDTQDQIDYSPLQCLYKENEHNNIFYSAQFKLAYKLNDQKIIAAWNNFREVAHQCSWNFDSLFIKEELQELMQKIFELDRIITAILFDFDIRGGDLWMIARENLWPFLKAQNIQTTLPTDGKRSCLLLLAFFNKTYFKQELVFPHPAIPQLQLPGGTSNSIITYTGNIIQCSALMLRPLIFNNMLENKTSVTEEELAVCLDTWEINLEKNQQEILSDVLRNFMTTAFFQAQEIVSHVIIAEECAEAMVKSNTVVDESLMMVDDKGKMEARPFVDQAAYRYRIAKQKYCLSEQETALLLEVINHPIDGFSKLVPKLSHEDIKANEQRPEDQKIIEYQEFLNRITTLIIELESKNQRATRRRFGLDKYRVDHLKAAADFIEYLLHKYHQVTHPEVRLKAGQRRGDEQTYKNFIAQLQIATTQAGMDNKNSTFRQVFEEVVEGLSWLPPSNSALKSLRSHYFARVDEFNDLKKTTLRIATKRASNVQEWEDKKRVRYDQTTKVLSQFGTFFELRNLGARNTEWSRNYQAISGYLSDQVTNADADYRAIVQKFMATFELEEFKPKSNSAMNRVANMIEQLRQVKKAVQEFSANYAKVLLDHINALKMLQEVLKSIHHDLQNQAEDCQTILPSLINNEMDKFCNAQAYLAFVHLNGALPEEIYLRSEAQMAMIRGYLIEIKTLENFNSLIEQIRQVIPELQSYQVYELARIKRVAQEVKNAVQGTKYMAEHTTQSFSKPIL